MVTSRHDDDVLEEAKQLIADAYQDTELRIEQDPMLRVNPRTLRFVHTVGTPCALCCAVRDAERQVQEMETAFKADSREVAGEYSRRPLLFLIIFFFGEALIEYARYTSACVAWCDVTAYAVGIVSCRPERVFFSNDDAKDSVIATIFGVR